MIVWPNMMGPGWAQELLLAALMQCGIIGVLALVWRTAGRRSGAPDLDDALTLHRRYEQGDLTLQEFTRLRRATPGLTHGGPGLPVSGVPRARRATKPSAVAPSWVLF